MRKQIEIELSQDIAEQASPVTHTLRFEKVIFR